MTEDEELLIRENIAIMRQQLNCLIDKENIDKDIVLQLSRKLDMLIAEFYKKQLTHSFIQNYYE